ncbi:unnamed protein product [Mucor hiemalis]
MTEDDKKYMEWSYIKLQENMLARSRLRKNQHLKPLDGSVATMVSDESKVLQLEAKVVCASNTDQPIRMCAGCVRRERKRAERTKDGKQKNEIPLSPEELEKERDRILLFNCSPMINFSSGDAILPTRITCYCRHHNEKVGFKICFVMKNDKGEIVGTGISPPIMITDDHKSSKHKSNRKRSREEENSTISRPDTPATSRRGSISTDDSPLSLTSSRRDTIMSAQLTPLQTPSVEVDGEDEELITPTTLEFMNNNINKFNLSPTDQRNPNVSMFNNDNNSLITNTTAEEAWPFNRRRRTNRGYTSSDTNATMISSILDDFASVVPQLDRLVPAQGPTYGGVEVTLLGSGFHRGLTCLFGEHAATTTYWNSNTLVCILPPAAQTGPVVVSFKEHPLVLEGHDVAIFTYYDASDQALLELALQVVGLKMTGKLQDAKSVAMRIVQGVQQSSNSQPQQSSNIQQGLIESLELSNTTDALDLSVTNSCGHSLLHIAVILGNETLVKTLVNCYPLERKAKLLNTQDNNEMTPLHFACQLNSVDMVRLLLHSGCNPSIESKFGLALSSDPSILDLLDLYTNNHIKRKPLSRRPSVKSHMMHRFHSLSNTSKQQTDNQAKTPSMESDGLGFVRQKSDRRLYLFWLPVLILAIGLLGVQMIGKRPSLLNPILEKLPDRNSITLS